MPRYTFCSSGKIFYFLLTCCLLCTFSQAHAQGRKQDVVYLKNGSIIRGKLLTAPTDTLIKIETRDHSIWAFPLKDISSITNEVTPAVDYGMRNKGYYNVSQFGFTVGGSNNYYYSTSPIFSLSTVNGYRFNPYFSIGAATAVDFYSNYNLLPVGIDIRGVFMRKPVTPYYFAQGGYGLILDNNWENRSLEGGRMFQVGLGLQFRLSDKTALVAELAFKSQKVTSKYTGWNNIKYTERHYSDRTAINIGFMF
jgi:hypothetical protein